MKFWGVYLSQLRLAPLQMMLAGHPSSSFSPEIDYCLLFRWSTNIEQLQPFFSEKIIMGDIPTDRVGFHTRHSGLTDSFLSEHNHFLVEDEEMIIGINGVMAKVTADIIDICKRIQQGTSKKLTFVFFSQHKSNQLAYLAAKKQISRELKNFELICFSDYISYMKTISQCHFLLPTLPFGGSNSNIDAMVLNKPKLFIRGTAQIYTVCDQWEWERVSLNNELGCNNEDDLVTKSLQLIDDNQYRKNIHELLVEKCSLEKIFPEHGGGGDLLSDVFTKAIEHAVSH
jgi:predicted O-linked N-acetylglucosamine transferase (SPINDLY family)